MPGDGQGTICGRDADENTNRCLLTFLWSEWICHTVIAGALDRYTLLGEGGSAGGGDSALETLSLRTFGRFVCFCVSCVQNTPQLVCTWPHAVYRGHPGLQKGARRWVPHPQTACIASLQMSLGVDGPALGRCQE